MRGGRRAAPARERSCCLNTSPCGHPDSLARLPQPRGPARWRAVLQAPGLGVLARPPGRPHLVSAALPPRAAAPAASLQAPEYCGLVKFPQAAPSLEPPGTRDSWPPQSPGPQRCSCRATSLGAERSLSPRRDQEPHLQPELWALRWPRAALLQHGGEDACCLSRRPASASVGFGHTGSWEVPTAKAVNPQPLSLFQSGGWRLSGRGFRALTPGPRPLPALGPHSAPSCQALGDGRPGLQPQQPLLPRPVLSTSTPGPPGSLHRQGLRGMGTTVLLGPDQAGRYGGDKGSPCNVGPTGPCRSSGAPAEAPAGAGVRGLRYPSVGRSGGRRSRPRAHAHTALDQEALLLGFLVKFSERPLRSPHGRGRWDPTCPWAGASRKPALPAPPAPRPGRRAPVNQASSQSTRTAPPSGKSGRPSPETGRLLHEPETVLCSCPCRPNSLLNCLGDFASEFPRPAGPRPHGCRSRDGVSTKTVLRGRPTHVRAAAAPQLSQVTSVLPHCAPRVTLCHVPCGSPGL